MREFLVRSLLHGAALGNDGDAAAAVLLAADIENPSLDRLVVAGTGELTASTQIGADRPLLRP
jgi:hypothetical protein